MVRRLLLLFVFLCLSFGSAARLGAQSTDPSDLFLNAYLSVQQGEKLERDGSLPQALAKFRYAAGQLDLVQQRYPNWQPLIVEYRKKRTSENIVRLEEQLGVTAAATPGAPPPTTPGLAATPGPAMGNPPDDSLSGPLPSLATPAPNNNPPEPNPDARDRLSQLQSDLKDSREQLRAAQREKEQIADRLNDALQQLDTSKSNIADLKARIQSATAGLPMNAPDTAERAALQKQIAALQEQLADAQAEREAADVVNSDYTRRLAKVRTSVLAVTKDRAATQEKLKELEGKYANAAKLEKELTAAKAQVAKLTESNQSATEAGGATAQKLAAAQKQLAAATKDRDAARKEADDLTKKLTSAQQEVVSVKAERDKLAKQRDQALADLAKAREAGKKVDQLLAENATLSAKLSDAEATIKDFGKGAPKKDEEVAALRKEVGETKDALAAAQKQNTEYKTSMAGLQTQLDKAKADLAQMQASGASTADKQKYAEENDLLRGIVLRQLKEQARREQAKKLVLSELQRLEVQSGTLIQQIDYLAQPVVKLTDQEKALFKQPQIEIADANSSEMGFSVAAPKPEQKGSPAPSPTASAAPSATASPMPSASPEMNPLPDSSPSAAASATPTDMANLTNTPSLAPLTKPGETTPETPGETDLPKSPQVETLTSPNVPPALMADARSAKEQFDRGQYRDSERTYEKMLSKAPNNVYILSNLGVVEFRQNKMKLAEEKFKKSIALAPDDSFSLRTLGIVYYQQGKFDEAVNALTKAIGITPRDAVAHNYLGIAASQKGWQEAALKELETALALDANYADANFNLAVIYATMQPPNKEAAQKFYKRAIALGADPDPALEQLINK